MKASEKIKIGLEHCRSNAPCMKCPYYEFRDRKYTCEGYLMFAALTYIQQLECSLDIAGKEIHEIAIMLQDAIGKGDGVCSNKQGGQTP